MAFNAIETQKLVDDYKTVTYKITGIANSAWTANSTVITANTLNFANSSVYCPLILLKVQYSVDAPQNNGYVRLHWVSKTANANQAIFNFSTSDDGVFEAWMPNNATNPSGDIGVALSMPANSIFNFIMTFLKDNSTGAWANGYIDTTSGTYY